LHGNHENNKYLKSTSYGAFQKRYFMVEGGVYEIHEVKYEFSIKKFKTSHAISEADSFMYQTLRKFSINYVSSRTL
jgi:hypothetical protein